MHQNKFSADHCAEIPKLTKLERAEFLRKWFLTSFLTLCDLATDVYQAITFLLRGQKFLFGLSTAMLFLPGIIYLILGFCLFQDHQDFQCFYVVIFGKKF